MNLLQHCLLKLGEESGEIASALLSNHSISSGSSTLSDTESINNEINDLEAVITRLNSEFGFNFSLKSNTKHIALEQEYAKEGLLFWGLNTAKSCVELDKIASKCIQFGFQANEAQGRPDNLSMLSEAIGDVFFRINQLNRFGLHYVRDAEHIKRKLEKIEYYFQISLKKKCVSEDPVEHLLPKHLVRPSNYLG